MKKLILFIHGLGGSSDTWGKFPELIEEDTSVDKDAYEFVTYEYSSPHIDPKATLSIVGKIGSFFKIPYASAVTTGVSALLGDLHNINEIARLLHARIESTYSEYEDIYIVAHSMGGLIAQKYIVDRLNTEKSLKVKKLMLYDVPNQGSSLAHIAKVYKHKQIEQLGKNSEFITELNRRREFKEINAKVDTQYIVCFRGVVVDTVSATAGYRDALEIERTHTGIVKPESHNDEVYIVWKNFILGSGSIIETLFESLSKPNAVPQMVITQNGVNRLSCINSIKAKATEHYDPRDIYYLALPYEKMSKAEYFQEIAYRFKSRETKTNRIRRDIIKLIKESRENVFLLITNFENDNHLDVFAQFMRSILDEVGTKLKVITIGGEKLANLRTNMGINSYFDYFEKTYIKN